jgi:hypothetical protein
MTPMSTPTTTPTPAVEVPWKRGEEKGVREVLVGEMMATLIDQGFTLEQAREALKRKNSVEGAVDWLLSGEMERLQLQREGSNSNTTTDIDASTADMLKWSREVKASRGQQQQEQEQEQQQKQQQQQNEFQAVAQKISRSISGEDSRLEEGIAEAVGLGLGLGKIMDSILD